MGVFVLHGNEPGTEVLLRHLQVPHGTALPSGEFGGCVIVWGEQKAEAVMAAVRKQMKAAAEKAIAAASTSVALAGTDEAQQKWDEAASPGKAAKVAGLWSSAKRSRPSAGARKHGKGSAVQGGEKPESAGTSSVEAAEREVSAAVASSAAKTRGTAAAAVAGSATKAGAASIAHTSVNGPTPHVEIAPTTGSPQPGGAAAAPEAVAPFAAYDGFLALPRLPVEPLRQLRAHGIEVDERTFGAGSETELLRRRQSLRDYPYVFRVPVFHLEALTLYRLPREALLLPGAGALRRPETFMEVGLGEPTYPSQRAVREAVRALYALGLDYGEAVVGIRAGGRLAVLDAWPQPDAGLGALYAEAIGRYAADYARERQRTEPAMLGADPEFLLVNPAGKVVAASRYLERDGEVGCDAIVLRGHRVITPLAELRPRPSAEPRKLAANLRGAMRLAASRIGDASLVWLAGGMPLRGFPLGGHIHFSRVWLNSQLLRALDNYLALPLMLIEADTTRQRRPRYGFLGDFRRQPHGGFEYRTLPSWMATPQVAVGVLSLARVIADGYRSLPAAAVSVGSGSGTRTRSGGIRTAGTAAMPARATDAAISAAAGALGRPLDDIRLLEAYYSGDKTALQPVVAELWQRLERLPGYAEFAADLAPLRERTLRMQPWSETADLRRAWKIPPFDSKRTVAPEIML